jgi:hypothetical protein
MTVRRLTRVVEWIQRERLPVQLQAFFEPAKLEHQPAVPPVRASRHGVELYCALVCGLGVAPAPLHLAHGAERKLDIGEIRVQCHSLIRIAFRLLQQNAVRRVLQIHEDALNVGERRVRRSVVGIFLHGSRQVLDGFQCAWYRPFLEQRPAAQVRVEGGAARCPTRGHRRPWPREPLQHRADHPPERTGVTCWLQPRQCADGFSRELIFDMQRLPGRAVEPLRPQQCALRGVGQLHRDPEQRVDLLNVALH